MSRMLSDRLRSRGAAPSVQLPESVMPKRNSPNDLKSLDDLSRLDEIIVDKRNEQRADAKKNRRNRHYGRQFIRNAIGRSFPDDTADDADG